MHLSKASIRYARALYALGEEMHVSDEVYANMHLLMDFFSEAKDMRALVANPVIHPNVKRKALRMIFQDHIDSLSVRFLDLIIAKNRSADIYGIVREYIELYRGKRGILRAVVRTARPLNEAEKAGFEAWFAQTWPDKQVEMVNKVRPELIGGFTLRVDGVFVDKSVAGRLQEMRRELSVKVYQKS